MLIAVLYGPSKEDVRNQIRHSLPFAQGFEFRLDLLSEEAFRDAAELRKEIELPVLFTLRKSSEGGACELDETERLQQLESLLQLEPEYCDIEASADRGWLREMNRRFPKVRFLVSYHNFEETPADLEGLYRSMQRPEASLYKISVNALSTLDMLRLMAFARGKKDLAWISMGPFGQPSRALGPITGSPFSYCGLENKESSLGQIDLQTLAQVYRFAHIDERTKIYALIGDPVEASIGHLYHNRVFAQRNENGLYVKLHLRSEELGPFFQWVRQLPFGGLSVTMPHKTAVLPFLDEIESSAREIGAVNTILCKKGALIGYNTDGEGALNALEQHVCVKGKRVGVLGAGGAAKAIVYEALRRGAEVHIFNRTLAKGRELADRFGASAHPWEELGRERFDVLISAIPHAWGELPLPPYLMEIDVKTDETEFAQISAGKGSTLISWKEMFYEQAALQQKIWEKA